MAQNHGTFAGVVVSPVWSESPDRALFFLSRFAGVRAKNVEATRNHRIAEGHEEILNPSPGTYPLLIYYRRQLNLYRGDDAVFR